MTLIETTKFESQGHLVIPAKLRKGFKEGEELVVTRVKNRLILERASEVAEQLQEDLEFAKRTDEAWKRYERGEFRSMPFDDFIAAMKTW